MSALLNLSTTAEIEPLVSSQAQPAILVVQPGADLVGTATLDLQQTLNAALKQVTTGVVVDLIWVRQCDATGIRVLIAAMQQAETAGKSLSFQAMKGNLRTVLEQEWASQREQVAGPRRDWFHSELADFCDRRSNFSCRK
jgi:anti-anti-sigma regulatory factor